MSAQPDILGQLTAAGVSVWLDDISRDRLNTGNLAELVKESHVRGVTSNPDNFRPCDGEGRRLRRPA